MKVSRRDRRTRDRDVPIRRVRRSDDGYAVSQRYTDHHRDRALKDLILEARDSDGTRFRPISLRDMHSVSYTHLTLPTILRV